MDTQQTIIILINEAVMCTAILTGVYRVQLLKSFQRAGALVQTAATTSRNRAFVQGALRQTIAQAEVLQLSGESARAFASLLADPPAPSPAMERARDHHNRLIGPL